MGQVVTILDKVQDMQRRWFSHVVRMHEERRPNTALNGRVKRHQAEEGTVLKSKQRKHASISTVPHKSQFIFPQMKAIINQTAFRISLFNIYHILHIMQVRKYLVSLDITSALLHINNTKLNKNKSPCIAQLHHQVFVTLHFKVPQKRLHDYFFSV